MASAFPSTSSGSSSGGGDQQPSSSGGGDQQPSSSGGGDQQPPSSSKALEMVFQHLRDDPMTLLNCSKTCKSWQNIIANQQTEQMGDQSMSADNKQQVNNVTENLCTGISKQCQISPKK